MSRHPFAPLLGAALLTAATLISGCTPAPINEPDPLTATDSTLPAWSKDTPPEIVAAYVTPDRFIDEEVLPWRETMRAKFLPVAENAPTRRAAILAIANDAEKICGVKYSTGRRAANQSVVESLESGKASCTGLSILLAAAYRSVGIPARLVGTGRWGDRPGNHTWVEVWDTDGWHAVEYYPDKNGLNHGWIYEPIARLDEADPYSRVIAVNPTGETYFPLAWYLPGKTIPGEDRTAHYQRRAHELGHSRVTSGLAADRGILVFEAHNAAGQRVETEFTLKEGDKVLFTGKTPSEKDDKNNAPRKTLSSKTEYTVLYRDSLGEQRVVRVTPHGGETTTLVLEVSR